MLMTDAMVDAVEPSLQVSEDEVDDRQILFGNLLVTALGDGEVIVAPLGWSPSRRPRTRHSAAYANAPSPSPTVNPVLRRHLRHRRTLGRAWKSKGLAHRLTIRADESATPAQFLKVKGAGLVVGEKPLELWKRVRNGRSSR